jgi:hypothetical protein
MRTTLLLLCFLGILCCKNKSQDNATAKASVSKTVSDAAVFVEMEGDIYTMQQKDLNPLTLNFEENNLNFSLYTNESVVQVNFLLKDVDILNEGFKTYAIPEDNVIDIKADLSFYNKNRNASRLNKRVVFRKGTIQIKEITNHKLVMIFKGEASGVTDSKNSFPISGSIHINY